MPPPSKIAATLALCAPLACHAGEQAFAYVDEQGGVHLTNVPDDARYASLYPAPAPPAMAPAAARARMADRPYSAVVERAARESGVEAALLHAVISVESAYDPKAVSSSGAAGLMQLMPATARRYRVADRFDPAQNVRGGARYLGDLLRLFDNDVRLALAAYHAGEQAVIRHGRRIPPFRATLDYVPKVVARYLKLQ